MKEKIIKKAGEVFLKFGFKSVTMDDIANEMAISKKTIYKYFKNKVELVDKTINYLHKRMQHGVFCICEQQYNAIEENFEIKKMFKDFFQNSDDSPMYQLQKYYPKSFNKIMNKEFKMFKECISNNIEKGISQGLYRKEIDKELITKFYFSLVMSVHDSSFYTYKNNSISKLEMSVLEYHTRAIATPKGIQILEQQLENNSN